MYNDILANHGNRAAKLSTIAATFVAIAVAVIFAPFAGLWALPLAVGAWLVTLCIAFLAYTAITWRRIKAIMAK